VHPGVYFEHQSLLYVFRIHKTLLWSELFVW